LEATAKQMPCGHDDRGLMPITSPTRRRGPRNCRVERRVGLHDVLDHPAGADCSERPSAETTPAVTVASKPSGLPIAMAI